MNNGSKTKVSVGYVIAILGTFLIMAAMVWLMRRYTQPAPLAADRVAERKKASAEVATASKAALETYGWIDPSKGIVRLPVDRAMELTIKNAQNPAASRSNLIARVEKKFPPPPPPAPSQFE
ncbi:MAG: hypothetical protein AB1813_21450 [Verrucomicrobiota bacterium]|jgi:hypothetical protein